MRILKGSPFWHTFRDGNLLTFTTLNNIAIQSNARDDYTAAIAASEKLPASQAEQVGTAIEKLRQKMEALPVTPPVESLAVPAATKPDELQARGTGNTSAGSKAELISTIEELTNTKPEAQAAKAIADSKTFGLEVVKELVIEAFFSKLPKEVRKDNTVRFVSMNIGALMGGAAFAKWLAENIVAGRSPAQMMDSPFKYGSFGMWQDAKELCEKLGIRFG